MRTAAGESIASDIRIWAAGVRGPDALKHLDGLELAKSNQLIVRPTLQTTRDDRIFAIGDCCYFLPSGNCRPIPPRAQAAHQMAETADRNIRNLIAQRPIEDFTYRDRGSLVSISRFSTVGTLMGN